MNPYDVPHSSPSESSQDDFSLKRKRRLKNVLPGVFGIFMVSFFWLSMTVCGCGHTDFATAIVIVPAFAFMLRFLPYVPQCKASHRIVICVFAILMSLMFVKNVTDILWFGHTPLFHRLPSGHLMK